MTRNSNILSSQLVLRLINNRRTTIFWFLLATTILVSSWNLLNSVLSWYACAITASSSSLFWWPTIYASMALGMIFGVLSMVAALAVVVPATMVTWICVIVLLTVCGKPRESVVMEGKKLTVEISRKVSMLMIKEGNLVAIVCTVFGYILLVRYGHMDE